MITWKDETSHSRHETDRSSKVLNARVAGLSITVHRHIHYSPDEWLLTAAPFYDKHVLTSKDLEEAKKEATAKIRACIRRIAAILESEQA